MALKHVRAIMNRVAREAGGGGAALTEIGERTRDPFRVLIGCLLSLRTRDETTERAAARLFRRARTPAGMLALPRPEIEQAIYPVGFYRTKAKRIHEICRILLEERDGRVPETLEALLALPGVGRKTANIVLVYGLGKPGLPIDTHCHRIPNRIGWVRTKTPEQTEAVLRQELPQRYWPAFNDLFVRFGQKVCRPIGPRCSACPVAPLCDFARERRRPR